MENNVKVIRKKKKMTQQDLAEKTGLSRPYISMLENDKQSVVKSDTMSIIAKALDEKVENIFLVN